MNLASGRPWPIAAAVALANVDPQAHELRRRLLDLVVRFPGLHLREIARMAEIPASHAQYHLRVLERNALVSSQKQDENLRYYPTKASPVGGVPTLGAPDRDLLQLLRRPTIFRILVSLLVDGPAPLTVLANRCQVTPSTMSYHLERLDSKALVVRDDATNAWSVKEPERVRAVLLAHEPPPAIVAGYLDVWNRLAP